MEPIKCDGCGKPYPQEFIAIDDEGCTICEFCAEEQDEEYLLSLNEFFEEESEDWD